MGALGMQPPLPALCSAHCRTDSCAGRETSLLMATSQMQEVLKGQGKASERRGRN